MRRHLYAIATLLVLALVVQCLVASRAVVPAQDSVRFVTLAQQIETEGLSSVWHESDEAAFATLVAGVHQVRGITSSISPETNWALTAQIAAALPAVLVVVPAYVLLTTWLGARVGLLGTIIFCLCPSVARLGADGLADSTHLLLAVGSLSLATVFIRRLKKIKVDPQPGWVVNAALMSICGTLWAGAVMIRPEALVVAPAIAAAVGLAVWQFGSRELLLKAIVSLGCFAIAAVGLFLLRASVTGSESAPLASVARMFSSAQAPRPDALDDDVAAHWQLADGEPMAFSYKEHTTTSRFSGLLPACGELFQEIPEAFGWVVLPLAVAGVCWHGRRWSEPVEFLQWAVIASVVIASTVYGASAGYLSSRHLMLATVPIAGWSGWACRFGGRSLRNRLLSTWTVDEAHWSTVPRLVIRPTVAAVVVLMIIATTIDAPLHESRIAHRRAASWLQSNANTQGAILDTRGWTKLYTGRTTYRYDEAPTALVDPELAYVVVEQRDLDFDSPRARTLREVLRRGGSRQAVIPGPDGQPSKCVLVYAWDAERFSRTVAEVLAN